MTPMLLMLPMLPPPTVYGVFASSNNFTASTTEYYLISAKTSLLFSFFGGSWSFMLSSSIIYACFYACSLEFFVLSIIIVSLQEHTALALRVRDDTGPSSARGGGTGEASGGVSGG